MFKGFWCAKKRVQEDFLPVLGIFDSMKATEHNLPVTIVQVLAWVRQCTDREKKMLIGELMGEAKVLLLASEKSLSKDWEGEEEDRIWKDL
ncbi:MAG: hypothetical protein JKX84_10765 [Flavobacteriales bacterium]|nr:hypothetical protein [Flavobacteriales bacterium]